jgi:hypothetical protein
MIIDLLIRVWILISMIVLIKISIEDNKGGKNGN